MPRVLSNVLAPLVLLLTIVVLAACQTIPETATTECTRAMCQAFQPITYSASGDTEETVLEILEHNAVWDVNCQ